MRAISPTFQPSPKKDFSSTQLGNTSVSAPTVMSRSTQFAPMRTRSPIITPHSTALHAHLARLHGHLAGSAFIYALLGGAGIVFLDDGLHSAFLMMRHAPRSTLFPYLTLFLFF